MSVLPATVLVVEDEVLVRAVLVDEFEDEGFRVLVAGSADAAVARMQAEEVSLVVTDARMSGRMDGLDLAAWVREHRPTVPVLVMSGYVHEEVVASAQASDGFVRKPFVPWKLVEQARAALARRRAPTRD